MSNKIRPQYPDQRGVIVETFVQNVGALSEGASIPADGRAGYAAGSLFLVREGAVGATLYVNEGTKTSCAFKPFASQTVKIARGQATTATASDTVVTGLATVVSCVANLEDAPVIGCDRAQAVKGDQAGTPAAGSILIQTYKPTGSGDATPIAATTFSKKVNWIAIGT